MQKNKKEFKSSTQKSKNSGHLLIRKTQVQKASEAEAIKIEQALDRLLSEIIQQEQARERNESS